MMSKVAFGIWKEDEREFQDIIFNLQPDEKRVVTTPDESYLVYFWDLLYFNEDLEKLQKKMRNFRHSYIEVTEDDRIYQDFQTDDARGCDEEFFDLLSWNVDFSTFDEIPETEKLSAENKKLKKLLQTLMNEEENPDVFLKKAGISKEEAGNLGLLPPEKEDVPPAIEVQKYHLSYEDNGWYHNSQIFIKGKPVLQFGRDFLYENHYLETKDYIYYGIHSHNPGCYEFLDRLLVIRKEDYEYKMVSLWDVIGYRPYKESSALIDLSIQKSQKNPEGLVVVSSQIGKAIVHPERIFAKDAQELEHFEPQGPLTELKNCFTYDITKGHGILLRLKEEIPKSHLLFFSGFSDDYDTFKFDSLHAFTKTLLFTNSKCGGSWQISWGNRTTMTTDAVWSRRDQLLQCVKEVIPNHPAYREDLYFEKC